MTDLPAIVPGQGSAGQALLVGESVYLRPLQPGDEHSTYLLRMAPFPTSRAKVREWIDGHAQKDPASALAIVRRTDDTVIGSVEIRHWDATVILTPFVSPAVGAASESCLAESVLLLRDYYLRDHGRPSVRTKLTADHADALRTATNGGFREVGRFREQMLVNGERVDTVFLQALHPAWIDRLGDPLQTPLERTGTGVPRPVPAHVGTGANPPKNAVMVGERLYLRPILKSDQQQETEASWREEEDIFGDGRWVMSPAKRDVDYGESISGEMDDYLWLQVCLRETDEMIGTVALSQYDPVNGWAESESFFFETAYRGAGYGFEAKHLLLEYAFDVLGLHVVTSWVNFHNTRSAAALRKQGYREAGLTCWAYSSAGTLHNMSMFDILADEWRALPRASAPTGGHHA